MALEQVALLYSSRHSQIPANLCESALKLLVEEQCSLPFVARYRKDRTGGLNEIQLKQVRELYEQSLAIEKRRNFILSTLEKKNILSDDLKRSIERAVSLQQLEDLYAPYKSKTPTKAQKAIEHGLGPLADILLTNTLPATDFEKTEEAKIFFGVEKEIKTFREALHGACDILIERFAHDPIVKDKVRRSLWREGKLISKKREKAETLKDYLKYEDFFDYSEDLNSLKNPKSGHRFLAMRRGAKHRVLKVEVSQNLEQFGQLTCEKYFPQKEALGFYEILKSCVERAYQNYLWPALDQEIKTELKLLADQAAIGVFSLNLQNLLLSPYLGAKAVMGIDPGVTSGCKVVVINNHGTFLGGTLIYPHGPKADVTAAETLLNKILELHPVEYIAIGNGTFGRETLEFVETKIEKVKSGQIKATLVSEAGASVYSASEIAQKEFPEIDVTVRGAISIARRFQDPLAELVKIDPKSIGVGQYQHDVNQTDLDKSLTQVVEFCVNQVGIDLNTASAPLLSYISGIGPKVSEQIVAHREFIGGFKNRHQLLEVPKFTEKTFEQAAGFLRIYQSKQPLDSTFIHPEHYTTLGSWVVARGKTIHDLPRNETLISELAQDNALEEKVGKLTFADILSALKSPVQDPRMEFKSVEFDKHLRSIKDLQIGTWYNGVISNITLFGAFVDLGLKEKGLIHVSQVAPRHVRNPLDQLRVGQEIRVKVIDVSIEKSRISLSAITDEMQAAAAKIKAQDEQNRKSYAEARANRKNESHSEQRRPPLRNHNPQVDKNSDTQSRNSRPKRQFHHEQQDQSSRPKQERPRNPHDRPKDNHKERRPRPNKELKQNPFNILKNFKINQ